MKVKMAQYGISHDHASGKARVMATSEEVDFCGIFEPSPEVRATLGTHAAYASVNWFSSKEDILEDESIVGIAARTSFAEPNLDGPVKSLLTLHQLICSHCGTRTYEADDHRFGLDLDFLRMRQPSHEKRLSTASMSGSINQRVMIWKRFGKY